MEGEEYELLELGVTLLAIFGLHGVITSILCLCAIGGHSKGFVIVSGILYFPISLLASILMFCIDPKDLNTY